MERRSPYIVILFRCLILSLAVLASVVSAAAQEIQVTSADPPEAPQGTLNLNVSIKGKGFKKGATAQFFVTSTANPGGVTVNSTTFKGPGELIANIDIADGAALAKFDIVVRNSDGRTGKGTELFSVTVAVGSTWASAQSTFRDATADRIRSDGDGTYDNQVDCVISAVSTQGNYLLRTVSPSECFAATPRTVVLDFSDPVPGSEPSTCLVPAPQSPSGPALNICGVNTAVVDVRVVANLFTSNALRKGVTVYVPISLQADFIGTDFQLEFERAVKVTGDETQRVLTAGSTAIAELYMNLNTGQRVSLGRFYMPFQLTVTRN